MMEASIGIAIFLEDAATYQKAMLVFAARVPAYIYLTSDGPYPIPGHGIGSSPSAIIKYWNGQSTYPVSGITQETCRDFAHTSYGIASISHVAETARIQGNDLWQTSVGTRVKAALELHSPFETGTKIPSWLCGGTIARSMDPGEPFPKFLCDLYIWRTFLPALEKKKEADIVYLQSLSHPTMLLPSDLTLRCLTRRSWCCNSVPRVLGNLYPFS